MKNGDPNNVLTLFYTEFLLITAKTCLQFNSIRRHSSSKYNLRNYLMPTKHIYSANKN